MLYLDFLKLRYSTKLNSTDYISSLSNLCMPEGNLDSGILKFLCFYFKRMLIIN
jgi:hypothetical protein